MSCSCFAHRGRQGARPVGIAGRGGMPVWVAGALAVLLTVSAGISYRVMAAKLKTALSTPLQLPVPLSAFPLQWSGWTGQDLPIGSTTKTYMETHFADDYISRRYVNTTRRLLADIYVVYCSSRPSGILGHKPRVCYPGNGWIWDETVASDIITRSGRSIRCLIHQFHKPAPVYQEIRVLNFYVLSGQITLREKDFSGFFDRRPNLAGDPARYVAQVQISSVSEHSARAAAADFIDMILSFLPDQQGYVEAANRVAPSEPVPEVVE